MSDAVDAPKPTTPETTESSSQPAWLTLLDSKIEQDKDAIPSEAEGTYLNIIRDMLLARDHDAAAVPQAVKRFLDHCTASLADKEYGMGRHDENPSGYELNAVAVIALDLGIEIPFTDSKQDRLADMLLGIKNAAVKEPDTNSPHFIYQDWGVETAVREYWHSHADGYMQDSEDTPLKTAANEWLNVSALLAKFFKRGLLDECVGWVTKDLEYALETRTYGDIVTNIGRQSQVLAAANLILVGGENLAKEVKTPSRKWHMELSAARWKLWASKFQEAADAASEDSEWCLKSRIQKAHDKMVELYPEAFQ
ncbi:hypothetical protein FALBO_8619 [Fusarium albosuccineum]|uniref:Uncharacterized protein n=1 Tax=Fusarium albosuccineum TaxID=1237068 RepID=A0A8H4PCP6_9HYPO|nr:hypothetical protein FALBO_8619 [Fusarium albosuccineum]